MEQPSREELLLQIRTLSKEITSYFELDPETAQQNFQLKLEGKTYKIVDKAKEREQIQKKWLSKINVNYNSAQEKFFRIWDLLQNNPELDLCVVFDSLENKRIFQIHKWGTRLECVCLSTHEISVIQENLPSFLKSIALRGISQREFEAILKWQQNIVSNDNQINEQLPKISWNGQRYHWRAASYEISIHKNNVKVFAPYCKFFAKLGICTNKSCKFVHDPRTVSICRDFFTKGTCQYGDNCRLTHSRVGSEYTVPHCERNLQGKCELTDGVEIAFSTSDLKENHCHYMHSPIVRGDYPLCRQFSHMGYCYRGMHCRFPHLWSCPDLYYTGQCFLVHCKYPHDHHSPKLLASQKVSLDAIPAGDFLLPPLNPRKQFMLSGGWYGLRTSQQSIDVRARSSATETKYDKKMSPLQVSDDSSSEQTLESSETSSDLSEFSEGELDADFIRV